MKVKTLLFGAVVLCGPTPGARRWKIDALVMRALTGAYLQRSFPSFFFLFCSRDRCAYIYFPLRAVGFVDT